VKGKKKRVPGKKTHPGDGRETLRGGGARGRGTNLSRKLVIRERRGNRITAVRADDLKKEDRLGKVGRLKGEFLHTTDTPRKGSGCSGKSPDASMA